MANDNKKIVEEAAKWFVTLRDTRELSAAEELQWPQEFSNWLKQSDEHVHEYLMISQVWGDVGELETPVEIEQVGADEGEAAGKPGADGADRAPVSVARDHSQAAAVAASPESASAPRQRRIRWPYYAVAAGLLLALSALFFWPSPARLYETGLGEQRTVSLADGSTVKLNTLSAIRFSFEDEARWVQLIRGEALFYVKPDYQRPFIVDTRVASGRAFVKVLGTTFNIYQKDRETAVTVLEGRVLVAPGAYDRAVARPTPEKTRQGPKSGMDQGGKDRVEKTASGLQQVELQSGQQAVLMVAESDSGAREGPDRPIDLQVINDVDTTRFIAWTERRLVFDGQSLALIAEEFNRYNPRQLEIESAALASLQLSGVFSSSDPDSLILYISQIRDITVTTRADGARVIREKK